MNVRWKIMKTMVIGTVATTEPAISTSQAVRFFTTKRARPSGIEQVVGYRQHVLPEQEDAERARASGKAATWQSGTVATAHHGKGHGFRPGRPVGAVEGPSAQTTGSSGSGSGSILLAHVSAACCVAKIRLLLLLSSALTVTR